MEGEQERLGADVGSGRTKSRPRIRTVQRCPRKANKRNPFYLVKDESVVEDTEVRQHCHQPSLQKWKGGSSCCQPGSPDGSSRRTVLSRLS